MRSMSFFFLYKHCFGRWWLLCVKRSTSMLSQAMKAA